MSKVITITERQKWFINCAIEAKDAILPLNEKSLDAKIFKQDYGVSKKQVHKEIADLKKKLK